MDSICDGESKQIYTLYEIQSRTSESSGVKSRTMDIWFGAVKGVDQRRACRAEPCNGVRLPIVAFSSMQPKSFDVFQASWGINSGIQGLQLCMADAVTWNRRFQNCNHFTSSDH